MTMADRGMATRRAARKRLLGFGAAVMGAAMCASVASTMIPDSVRAQVVAVAPGETGTIVRSGNGIVVGTNSTVVPTFVIVAPGGVLLGADRTPIANVTPVTYVNGAVSTTASGPASAQTISTPTVVGQPAAAAPVAPAPIPAINGANPNPFIIGALDGPLNGGMGLPPAVTTGGFPGPQPLPAQTISTPTVVAGQVGAVFEATATPAFSQSISTPTPLSGSTSGQVSGTNQNVVITTPGGGAAGAGNVGGIRGGSAR